MNGHLFVSLTDKKSTIFVIFEIIVNGTIRRCLTEKLALIPEDTKLLITPGTVQWKGIEEMSESLCVTYKPKLQLFVDTMRKVLSKRWQTLDLISMMRELQRTLPLMVSEIVTINDSLSSLPRFQKAVKQP